MKSQPMRTGADVIGIAGAGRIGQALGRLLRERGQPVAAIAGRDPERTAAAAAFVGGGAAAVRYEQLPARTGRLLLAVPDDAISAVAGVLARSAAAPGLALHTCGAKGVEALAPLAARGFSCGTLHPLQTVATPKQGLTALPGAAFAILGEGAAAEWAEEIARLLGGTVLRVAASSGRIYHAAAVMASNYVVGLIDAAARLMSRAGIPEETALAALGPLVRASVDNALEQGPVRALTGPIERGDAGTVAAHLEALSAGAPELETLYRAAGRYVLEIARRGGLPAAAAEKLEQCLKP